MNYYIVPGLKKELMEWKRLIKKDIIIKAVCDHFGLKIHHLKGSKRYTGFTKPRHMAFLLLHKYTAMNKTEIGEEFNRDHTTVIHGMKSIKDLIKTSPGLMDDYAQIESVIKNV